MNENLDLNTVVSNLYNYSKVVKYFHWQYQDRDFWLIHPKLDKVYEMFLDHADTLAEIGRQNDYDINPWAEVEQAINTPSNHSTAVDAIVEMLQDIYNQYVILRTMTLETYVQSEIDALQYEIRIALWKWNSSK